MSSLESTKVPQNTIETMLANNLIAEYFNQQELISLCNHIKQKIFLVLGTKFADLATSIEFESDEDMYFSFSDKKIHIGLGILERMIKTFQNDASLSKDQVKQAVINSILSDALHEAGHAVIDIPPDQVGISIKSVGGFGASSLFNAVLDIRNDHRIILHHPDEAEKMRLNMQFAFMPGGRLDWDTKYTETLDELGYIPLFSQFNIESIRRSFYRSTSSRTDKRVRKLIDTHTDDLDQVQNSPKCIPGLNPSVPEKKVKAKTTYTLAAKINQGEYQELLKRDKENQAVSQAISLVGLQLIGYQKDPKIREIILKFLKELAVKNPNLSIELNNALAEQKKQKVKTPITTTTETQLSVSEATPDTEVALPKSKLQILGPAVQVETLSEELRAELIRLFEELQQNQQDNLQELIKQLLENPEEFLKELEKILNKKLEGKLVPKTIPNDENANEPKNPELPNELPVLQTAQEAPMVEYKKQSIFPEELQETEKWLESNFNLDYYKARWRDAIKYYVNGSNELTHEPADEINIEGIVDNLITAMAGQVPNEPNFIKVNVPKKGKVNISILWRTQAVNYKEVLKLTMFLLKMLEDPIIAKYLDLEVLISQKVAGLSAEESGIGALLPFGTRTEELYSTIVQNLSKVSRSGSSLPINEDPLALEVQRKRILRQPVDEKRFAIDIWDELAMSSQHASPMQAVNAQIQQTQQALGGKAFCIALKENGKFTGNASNYGENSFTTNTSVETILKYLDILVVNMVKYKDSIALRVKSNPTYQDEK